MMNNKGVEMKHPRMMRNIVLLSFAWCFGIASAFIQISTTTVVAVELEKENLATLPLGLILFGAAFAAGFVPKLVERFGARMVYCAGAGLGFVGAMIEFIGLIAFPSNNDAAFALIVVGCLPQGFTYACTNTYRLKVTEFSTVEFRDKAISLVVAGGILGAFIGPEVGKYSRFMLDEYPYAGSYIHVAILYLCLFVSVYAVDWPPASSTKNMNCDDVAVQARPLRRIFFRGEFMSIVVLQAVSYSAMGALMAATPLAMKSDGFSFKESSTVITVHMLGMFVPSLITGSLVKKFKSYPVMVSGFLILLVGALIMLANPPTFASYAVGICLVGIGWNFSFVPATGKFIAMYEPSEKAKTQSLNDLLVIGALGLILFFTAAIYKAVGWTSFVIIFSVYTALALILSSYWCFLSCRSDEAQNQTQAKPASQLNKTDSVNNV